MNKLQIPVRDLNIRLVDCFGYTMSVDRRYCDFKNNFQRFLNKKNVLQRMNAYQMVT